MDSSTVLGAADAALFVDALGVALLTASGIAVAGAIVSWTRGRV